MAEEVKNEEVVVKATRSKKTEEEQAILPKTYKIRIPRERDNNEDVYVSVNDRTWVIKRGVEVEVPACVAEVLRHQEEMLDVIYEFEESKAK